MPKLRGGRGGGIGVDNRLGGAGEGWKYFVF